MSARLPLAGPTEVRAWIGRSARANRRWFTSMMLLFGLATVVGLAGPQLLGILVRTVVEDGPVRRVDVLAGAFLVVLVAEALLMRAALLRASRLGEHLLARTREEFVEHVLRLPQDTVEAAGTGDLLSRATSDVDKLDRAVREAVPEIVVALVALLLTTVAMVATSPLLAAGMLVAVPVVVVSTRWFFPRARHTLEHMLAKWADVQSSTHESVDGARTIGSLRLGERRRAHNDRVLGQAVTGEKRHRRLLTVFLPSLELSYVLPLAAILALGGWAYSAGLVGLGTVTTVVLYAQALSDPMDELMSWAEELQVGHAALRRVLGVRQVPVERPDASAPTERTGPHDITVRGLRFAYRPGREVLHGIDLHVPAGSRLAVVGPSGAGKSTLGRLIAGVSPPGAGSVTAGDVDITALPTERLRREVVLLTQENHVFACSLRRNLALPGERDFGDGGLLDALDTVGALEWAQQLPDGLDTVLGAGGHAVSTASAQRIALARVVLADPHTLVLDEATSLLDDTTSRDLERSLSAVLTGRTIIAIAHRPGVAENADRVAVMEGGRLVELGSHAELLAADGSYARLHHAVGASTDRLAW